jgi:BirA family biotin operon repressor/biotin-[acetyl-CoA-carboxylase] ligase
VAEIYIASLKTCAFNLARIRLSLKPFRLHWFPRLGSTNTHATALRRRGELFAPAVVLTGHQLAGRGRGSNTWWSGAGSITATFVLAADEHLAPHHVPLIAGLATRAAAAGVSGCDDIQLKWPNDLLHRGRKLAGLLCERSGGVDLIGIGINVNTAMADIPAHLRSRVTSLADVAGRRLDINQVLIALAVELHRRLAHRDESSFPAALREYDQHHALLGQRITVNTMLDDPAITGRCEGLDSMGRLLVRDRRALHHVIAGHVQML